MKKGYIVTISAGNFFDRVVSLAPSVDAAVESALKYYRAASATPGVRPEIKAEPTQVIR